MPLRQFCFRISALIVLGLAMCWGDTITAPAQAALAGLNCSSAYQIDKTFQNGNGWSMCFTPVKGYGFVVSDLRYKKYGSQPVRVIESMHIAQMFVPYDNNAARYHDIGYGVSLATLTTSDCPAPGTISSDGSLCISVESRGSASASSVANASSALTQQGERLRLFGYYGIGAYYYTFQFLLHDDGAIEPMLGASGSLQWLSTDKTTGWPVSALSKNKNYIGVNHNHLAIWRIHFAIDDGVAISPPTTSINQVSNATPAKLTTEASVLNNLSTNQYWTVSAQINSNTMAFQIEPSVDSQLRASTESFTLNDFYLTQYNANEILIDGGLTSTYVNGETVSDPVIWYGVNFHHVPRQEDNTRMPQHWQGFVIRPLQ